MLVDDLLLQSPYCLDEKEKRAVFLPALEETMLYHLDSSLPFRHWVKNRGARIGKSVDITEFPFVPVQVFKEKDLVTVGENEIVDVRHSSSTTSGVPSLVKRDSVTLKRYRLSRNSTLNNYCSVSEGVQLGIIEDPDENPDARLSANLILHVIASRAAKGQTYYVVRRNGSEVEVQVQKFLDLVDQFNGNLSLIFGHLAYIYLFLIAELNALGVKLNLPNVTLLFGWGWKKFADKAVSLDVFRQGVHSTLGIPPSSVLDMYGFAESNTLYLECPAGFRHVPIWEEALARCPKSLKPVADGQEGLLQFLSAIPRSYAGASVLVDDIGFVLRAGNPCPCGRKGTRFKLLRRSNSDEKAAFNSLSAEFCNQPGWGKE